MFQEKNFVKSFLNILNFALHCENKDENLMHFFIKFKSELEFTKNWQIRVCVQVFHSQVFEFKFKFELTNNQQVQVRVTDDKP